MKLFATIILSIILLGCASIQTKCNEACEAKGDVCVGYKNVPMRSYKDVSNDIMCQCTKTNTWL